MEDNKDMVSSTETEQAETGTAENNSEEPKKGKVYTRSELNSIISAEKDKLKAELLKEFEDKKSEAEKLAKMDAEQKLNYELKQSKKENENLKNQINSLTLKTQANAYATEKGLPLGYIEDLDFGRETAESIKEKVDKLVQLRSNDLNGYLNEKLKQNPPKAVPENKTSEEDDPFIRGFKNYKK